MAKSDGHFRVLIVDSDADLVDIVAAVLTDEGYSVGSLLTADHRAVAAAIGMQEPDCVLLDGAVDTSYGASWEEAAYLAARERSIPTIMLTAHATDVAEARESESPRAAAASFASVISKPFDIDELIAAVASACARSDRFDHSAAGDRSRTSALARQLRAAGATDVRTGYRREWATFRWVDSRPLYQVYWWQHLGVYLVGRYGEDGRLVRAGQFFELGAAIEATRSHAR